MYEKLLSCFDESGIDPSNTVIQCYTQNEADLFLQYLVAKGVWEKKSADILSKRWMDHCQCTCYRISSKGWCNAAWYREFCPSIKIVDFQDIYKGDAGELSEPVIGFDEIMNGGVA